MRQRRETPRGLEEYRVIVICNSQWIHFVGVWTQVAAGGGRGSGERVWFYEGVHCKFTVMMPCSALLNCVVGKHTHMAWCCNQISQLWDNWLLACQGAFRDMIGCLNARKGALVGLFVTWLSDRQSQNKIVCRVNKLQTIFYSYSVTQYSTILERLRSNKLESVVTIMDNTNCPNKKLNVKSFISDFSW